MMDKIFICPFCGNLDKSIKDTDEIIKRTKLCSCGEKLLMEYCYPILQAQDLILTSQELYNLCKSADKTNRIQMQEFLKNEGIHISDEELSRYINIYETVRAKYSDNNREHFTSILDEIEDKIRSKYNTDLKIIDTFLSYSYQVLRNRFRKTLIIVVASSIEMLFNDFFDQLILRRLGVDGGNAFLSNCKYAGINECLNICNSFVDNALKIRMNAIKDGFYDRWSSLRNERNSIIHSNNKYISSKRASEAQRLIQESVLIFSNLKSQVYAQSIFSR
ncbi:MAG: hypothetical protein P4L59_21620 [Desulfosporosinus sp.]|nr:hypothetical protein [Desulfosporosinus sp.]